MWARVVQGGTLGVLIFAGTISLKDKTTRFMAVLADLEQKISLSPNHGGRHLFCP